jgi:hypothetical protein
MTPGAVKPPRPGNAGAYRPSYWASRKRQNRLTFAVRLVWLGKQIGDELLDALIITTGEEAYRRPDGIAVIPASLLGL